MYIANLDDPNYVEIARTLLKHGADVDIPNKIVISILSLLLVVV